MSVKITKEDIYKLYGGISKYTEDALEAARQCHIDGVILNFMDYEEASDTLAKLVSNLANVGALSPQDAEEVLGDLASSHDMEYIGTLRGVKSTLEKKCKCELGPLGIDRFVQIIKELKKEVK